MMNSFTTRPALFLLCLLLFLPFLGKAFHIDDAGFLELARMVDWNPLRTAAEAAGGTGTSMDPRSLPYGATHTVLMPYLVKVLAALFGEREVPLHAAFLLFSLASLASLAALFERWYPAPPGRTSGMVLLFAAIPAFLVSGQSIMADVPTLAFLLASLLAFERAFGTGRRAPALLGGLLLAFAVFASYQMLAFVPLILFAARLRGRINRTVIMGAFLPVVLLAVWLALVYVRHGHVPIAPADLAGTGSGIAAELRRGLRPDVLFGKAVFLFALLGASLLFVVLVRLLSIRSAARALARIAVAGLVCCVPLARGVRYSPLETAGLAFLCGVGAVAVFDAVRAGLTGRIEERARDRFLAAWAVTVIGYNLLFMPFGSARYLLPALPPLVLLLLHVPPDQAAAGERGTAKAAVIILALLWGVASAASDQAYAGAYRSFAKEVRQFRDNRPQTVTTWYIGKWGMQFYLEREGCRVLPAGSQAPRKGDFLIIPEMPRFWQPAPEVGRRMAFYASREFRSALPLRLFNRRSNAGFYAHLWGLLPFAFSREPDEVFQVWEVTS